MLNVLSIKYTFLPRSITGPADTDSRCMTMMVGELK